MTTDFRPNGHTAFSHPGHPPATITEHRGIRYMHLGTKWVQGAMRLDKPDAIELEYVQMMMMWMLFKTQPKRIVQLGLGSAALTKFSYRRFPDASVTAIELNPNVIAICGAQFALPPNDARLDVREMNALDFVLDPANQRQPQRRRTRRTARQPHLPVAGRRRPDHRRPLDLRRPRLPGHRPGTRVVA